MLEYNLLMLEYKLLMLEYHLKNRTYATMGVGGPHASWWIRRISLCVCCSELWPEFGDYEPNVSSDLSYLSPDLSYLSWSSWSHKKRIYLSVSVSVRPEFTDSSAWLWVWFYCFLFHEFEFLPFSPPARHSQARYIITATDYLTRWAEAAPVKDCSADTAARFIFENIITRFGCPRSWTSDQGTHFINQTIATLTRSFLIQHHKSSPYHPQANGTVEAFNNILERDLAPRRDKRLRTLLKFVLPIGVIGMRGFLRHFWLIELPLKDCISTLHFSLFTGEKLLCLQSSWFLVCTLLKLQRCLMILLLRNGFMNYGI